MASVYKQQLIDWLSQLEVETDTVIDIGGSQDPVKGRTKSWAVDNYLIADLPDPHRMKQSPDVILDLEEDITTTQRADLIFCLEVFDYIRDPIKAHSNLSRMPKKNGSAWVSYPFIYPHHNPIELDGLRYTEPTIRYYADLFKLNVDEIVYRRPQSKLLREYFAADNYRSAPGYDHDVIGYIVRFSK
jgi:hypothetical protein